MTSRSRFYVDTPRDPSQRHSMFVTHPERQDLSSNSSCATLPSAAGSVDRLTGLDGEQKQKAKGFFTLKSKSSFSLRPFFRSTSSLVSLSSPGKRRKAAAAQRRDSYSQTEEARPERGEVGVQTLNASTVDVPVQTCLGAWEDGDSYGHRRRAYAPARASPFCGRTAVASATPYNPPIAKNASTDPLASPKLLKYAAPADSARPALFHQSAPPHVNSCLSTSPIERCSAAKEQFAGNNPPGRQPVSGSDPEPLSDSVSSDPKEGETCEILSPKGYTIVEYKVPEVSATLKYPTSQNIVEHPVSVLKTEGTDSPSRRPKSVHFDLAQSPNQIKKEDPVKPRNVDKDFEALLKDLNVLADDVNDLPVSPEPTSRNKSPSSNLLSPNLKSALDALREDFLTPIPENLNECNEESTKEIVTRGEDSNKSDDESGLAGNSPKPVNTAEFPTSPACEYEHQNKVVEENKNEPAEPTSPSAFTSAKSVSNPETDSLDGNVYDNVIKEENLVKTVPLPILPSFFQPPPSQPCASEIVESSGPKEDSQTQPAMPLQTEFDRTSRLSRPSSRSSMRSNSKPNGDAFLESGNRFDSCENLDQLEEEIIRSLYSPDEGKLEENIMNNIELPPSESFQNSGTTATHMRRVILDQLLSGKNVEDIVPKYPVYQRAHSLPETESRYKSPVKYTAVLTKMDSENNESPSTKYFENSLNASLNNSDSQPNSKLCDMKENSILLDARHSSLNVIESPKKTSVFIFPEDSISDSGNHEKSVVEISTSEHQTKGPSVLEVRRSSWTAHSAVKDENVVSDKEKTPDKKSGSCDFTNCLRPSKIQNSPFLAKINTRSMSPCNFSPTPPPQSSSYINISSTVKRNDSPAKPPEAVGECDFASCLKPSQVQNSMFTAELSEITSNKSTNSLRAGSPLTVRTQSPLAVRSGSSDTPNANRIEKSSVDNCPEPTKHKSELLITLQTAPKHSSDGAVTPETGSISNHLTKPENLDDKFSVVITPNEVSIEQPSHVIVEPGPLESVAASPPPPPPPPPPPSSGLKSPTVSAKNIICSSMETMIQEKKSNLSSVEVPIDSRSATPKTPVMIELELKLQNKNDSIRRNSADKTDDQCCTISNGHRETTSVGRCESILNGSRSYISNGNQNGNTGILSDEREHNSSLPIEKNDSHLHGTTKLTFSPTAVVTDEPPPPGAVLLDKKVTVDGDKVHTDKYYAIPVKEVLKEKTSTTKFIPAPPKYEGIGPTEDGVPTGLRNSVKKENMHNWYKTMFKSLHKADSANDSQEYIIGYTSEPETSKKDIMLRKKSSTLDNRLKHDTNSNYHKQNYTPVTKSSIEVYNVRPRLIEDYEPGYSSVTDDETILSRRYLPSRNTVKPSYEFKNGYESDSNITKRREQPEALTSDQQKMWYREIQKGGDIPQFGLGKPPPEKAKEPLIGPVPPPPLNYNGPSTYHQAVRPLTLPTDYSNQNGNGYCQQMNGLYEMQMRHAIHSEMQQRMSPSSNQLSPPNRTMIKSPSRSPDMKIPAQALFDFKAESPKEIPLKKGDMVLILRQLDKNWYEGEHKGVVGIFPISYVEIIPPEHTSTPVKVKPEGLGRALYDFVAQTSIELTVRKGDTIILLRRVDANWFEGIFNNKKGIIPISYVQVLQEPIDRNMSSPSQKSYIASPSASQSSDKQHKPNSISPSAYSSSSTSPLPVNQERRKLSNKKGVNLVEPVMYRALYSYNPQNSDELELQEGDSVYVVEMCDDGWYVGTSVRSGVFGIFPGNYVEKAH